MDNMDNMDNDNRFNSEIDWELLARRLAGEDSENDMEALAQWLTESPHNRDSFAILKKVYAAPEIPHREPGVHAIWDNIARRTGIEKKNRPHRWLKIAATVLILIALPLLIKLFFPSFFQGKGDRWNVLTVNNGQRQQITLADGSHVTLDAGSTLRYPDSFGKGQRTVYLEGEGMFNVTPDKRNGKRKSFIVYARHAVITVLGTRFNIRAWKDSGPVKVLVVEGKVSLGNSQRDVTLTRGQMSLLPKNGWPTLPQLVDIDKHLGWLKREMAFEDIPLMEILEQVERWYDIEFRFPPQKNTALSDRLTIHLRDLPLRDTLELITTLTGLHYTIKGRIITLSNTSSGQE